MALRIGLGFSRYHNLVIEERKKGGFSKGGARQFQHEPPYPPLPSLLLHLILRNCKNKGSPSNPTRNRDNCGGTDQCVIQAHVREGAVIRVEPDDRYNQNPGKEDQFLSDNDLILNNLARWPGNILYASTSARVGDLE
jgi:hypothetical protein